MVATAGEMQALADGWRAEGLSVGLVPTMGALHAGHESLVAASRAQDDRTVVSIFVNPLQFGPNEDFARYPRRMDADLALLADHEVHAVYAPGVEQMYQPGAATRVVVVAAELAQTLEAAHRPGHFEGVATVVTKLFIACRPHRAYFGQKDAQQVAVVRRLAADLDTGVEIVVGPTVREADGLAISSRNVYLDPAGRRAATLLYRALAAAELAYERGARDAGALAQEMREVLDREPLVQPDYAEIVTADTFSADAREPLLAVLAVRIGGTRLIDNHVLGTPLQT